MRSLLEERTPESTAELNAVMERITDRADISLFYGRVMQTSNGRELLPEVEYSIPSEELGGKVWFQFTPYHIHLNVDTKSEGFCKTILGNYEKYVTRFTKAVMAGEKFDYAFILSITSSDELNNKSYVLTLNNPTFVYKDDNGTMTLLFQTQEVLYGVEDVDFYALNDEVDLEVAEEEQREELDRARGLEDEFDENEDFIGSIVD